MESNGYAIAVYAVYALVAVGLTVWLARTLYRSGAVFLKDVFADRPGLAEAVNRLLVVGFYMANLGYALYILRTEPNRRLPRCPDARQSAGAPPSDTGRHSFRQRLRFLADTHPRRAAQASSSGCSSDVCSPAVGVGSEA